MDIRIIGTRKSEITRKTERYFSDRGIAYHFVDISKHPLSEGELSNIALRTGWDELVDTGSQAYRKKGFAYMEFDPAEELLADPMLVRIPIVRMGKNAAVGYLPETWNGWMKAE